MDQVEKLWDAGFRYSCINISQHEKSARIGRFFRVGGGERDRFRTILWRI